MIDFQVSGFEVLATIRAVAFFLPVELRSVLRAVVAR